MLTCIIKLHVDETGDSCIRIVNPTKKGIHLPANEVVASVCQVVLHQSVKLCDIRLSSCIASVCQVMLHPSVKLCRISLLS